MGFEPTIPANKRQQTEALDHAATGTGTYKCDQLKIIDICQKQCVFMLSIYLQITSKKETGVRL